MPQQREWKTNVLAAGTCWVILLWMFWYHSSYCKNYASSVFQQRENISPCAYETVFFSALHCWLGLFQNVRVRLTRGRKKKQKKTTKILHCLPALLLKFTLKRFKCQIRGNVLVLYWAQTGCTHWVNFSLIWNKRKIFFCVFAVRGKREKKNDWCEACCLICSSSLLSNKHRGQLHKHTYTNVPLHIGSQAQTGRKTDRY